MVSLSSKISPRTSTVIFFERSPFATAVVTSAMLRTWPVRLPAIEFTESVRSFHVPATPFTSAWPPSRPSVPTSRATRVTSAAHIDGDLLRQIAVRDCGRDFRNVTHLAGQVSGHRVHRVGEIFPRPGDAFHVGLTAKPPFRSHLTSHARHFRGERTELIDHRV